MENIKLNGFTVVLNSVPFEVEIVKDSFVTVDGVEAKVIAFDDGRQNTFASAKKDVSSLLSHVNAEITRFCNETMASEGLSLDEIMEQIAY
jgi:hypothetical protein